MTFHQIFTLDVNPRGFLKPLFLLLLLMLSTLKLIDVLNLPFVNEIEYLLAYLAYYYVFQFSINKEKSSRMTDHIYLSMPT